MALGGRGVDVGAGATNGRNGVDVTGGNILPLVVVGVPRSSSPKIDRALRRASSKSPRGFATLLTGVDRLSDAGRLSTLSFGWSESSSNLDALVMASRDGPATAFPLPVVNADICLGAAVGVACETKVSASSSTAERICNAFCIAVSEGGATARPLPFTNPILSDMTNSGGGMSSSVGSSSSSSSLSSIRDLF